MLLCVYVIMWNKTDTDHGQDGIRDLFMPYMIQYSNNTTQHNTTQHNTTQHNTTQHNTTQHNTSQHKTTQHNTTQHNTTQHNTTQHNTTQHNTTQHNTTQHNTCLFRLVLCCKLLYAERKYNSHGVWVIIIQPEFGICNQHYSTIESIVTPWH